VIHPDLVKRGEERRKGRGEKRREGGYGEERGGLQFTFLAKPVF